MSFQWNRPVSRVALALVLVPVFSNIVAHGSPAPQTFTTAIPDAPLPPLPHWSISAVSSADSAPQINVQRAALSHSILLPGSTLNVTALFVVTGRVTSRYDLNLALVDARGSTISEAHNNLDNSLIELPTSQWSGPIALTFPINVPWTAKERLFLMLSFSTPNGTVHVSSAGLQQDVRSRVYIGAIDVGRSTAPTPGTARPPIDLSRYSLTFEDTFNSASISDSAVNDLSRWYAQNEQCCMMATNGEETAMAAHSGSDNPFHIAQPAGLIIQLQRKGNRWTSGVLTSVDSLGNGFSQQYGYFEIRARFPAGLNTWPAFWLLNTASKRSGAQAGEIDIVEYIANPAFANYITTTLHDWSNKTTPAVSHHMVNLPSDGFHTYGMLWTASTMTFYYDGSVTFECPTPAIMHQPYYLLLDLGLGAGWPTANTPLSNNLEVQYVRVYQEH